MRYFFILGNNPTLSFAEIVSVFKIKPEQVLALTEKTLIIELAQEIDAQQIIRKLGGTIKIGVINFQFSIPRTRDNFQSLLNIALLAGLVTIMTTSFFSPYLNHPLGIGYVVLLSILLKK